MPRRSKPKIDLVIAEDGSLRAPGPTKMVREKKVKAVTVRHAEPRLHAITRRSRTKTSLPYGYALRICRRTSKITINRVRMLTGFSGSAIKAIEHGNGSLAMTTLERLAGIYGVSVRFVVELAEKIKQNPSELLAMEQDSEEPTDEWIMEILNAGNDARNGEAVSGGNAQDRKQPMGSSNQSLPEED